MSAALPIPSDHGQGPKDGGSATERQARTNLLLSGELIISGEPAPRPVRLRNLSADGAGLEMEAPPPVGTTLVLRRNGEETAAEVVWRGEDACGLRFTAPVDILHWMGERRRRAIRRMNDEPSLPEDLALIRQLVERLEDGLGDHPLLMAVLPGEMQAIDLIIQLLRAAEERADGRAPGEAEGVSRAARALLARGRRRTGA